MHRYKACNARATDNSAKLHKATTRALIINNRTSSSSKPGSLKAWAKMRKQRPDRHAHSETPPLRLLRYHPAAHRRRTQKRIERAARDRLVYLAAKLG